MPFYGDCKNSEHTSTLCRRKWDVLWVFVHAIALLAHTHTHPHAHTHLYAHTQQLSTARLDAVGALSTTGGAFSAPLWQKILTVALLPIPTLELSSQLRSLLVLPVSLKKKSMTWGQSHQHTGRTTWIQDVQWVQIIPCSLENNIIRLHLHSAVWNGWSCQQFLLQYVKSLC